MQKDDFFILSKGHAAPALYVILNYLNKITDTQLLTFSQDGTLFPSHPPYNMTSSIPFATGSLGHGLSFACGIAHGLRIKSPKKNNLPHVFCLLSDGECNEGQIWEAVQYATHFKLHNLIVLVDKNKIQAFGTQAEVLGDATTTEKWNSFGFDVYNTNGHNPKDIKDTFEKIFVRKNFKPKVILFETIKGYGISFMQNTLESHYIKFTKEQYTQARAEIEKNIL